MTSAKTSVQKAPVKKKKKDLTNIIAPLIVLVVIVAAVQIICTVFNVNEHVIPKPFDMVTETVRLFGDIWPHFLFTIKIVLLGFVISVPLGMLIAAVLSQSKVLTSALSPIILVLVITPMMTLVPLMLLWLGTNPNLRLLVIIVQATPIITFNTLNGFTHVEKEKLELGASVGASKLQTFIKITFMNAMPQVFTGVKLGCIFSVIGAISADFVGGKIGMGTRIVYYTKYNNTAVVFGCIILVALIGLALYYAVNALERRIVLWKK